MNNNTIINGKINIITTGLVSGNIKTSTVTRLSGNISMGSTTATRDYEQLINKPSIEYVELIGNKTFNDLGLSALSADDILDVLNN